MFQANIKIEVTMTIFEKTEEEVTSQAEEIVADLNKGVRIESEPLGLPAQASFTVEPAQ